jgi:hypothetical protein
MNIRFRTQSACRIAGIDRDRFNEAVAAGNYPCAPKVARGATRVFDEIDLVALFNYGRLIEQDIQPMKAGRLACHIVQCLRESSTNGIDEEKVVVVATTSGGYFAFAGSHIHNGLRAIQGMPGLVFLRFDFDVANVLALIRRESQDELSVFGEEDE